MTRRTLPAVARVALMASLTGLLSLASCDLAGDEGGPGSSAGILGSLPTGPLSTPFTLDSLRASIGLAAQQSNSYSFYPALSEDGRYVIFESQADNLVPGDVNGGTTDIYLRDTQLGETVLISVSSSGIQSNAQCMQPSMSDDGRFIVFASFANNLDEVVPDTNNQWDIFLRDRDPDEDGLFQDVVGAVADPDGAGTTERVTFQDGGSATESNFGSFRPSVSNDGDVVAFESSATNLLLTADSNNNQDIFVRIRSTETTRRMSFEAPAIVGFPNGPDGVADGDNLSGFQFNGVVCGDGTYVVYMTSASDAVYGDTNGYYDVFRVDVNTLAVDRVSLGTGNVQPNSYSYTFYYSSGTRSVSNDGSRVSFSSSASNITANDTNGQYDVFVRDFNTGTVTRVMAPGNQQPNGFTFDGRLTGDGTRLTFISQASNMGPDLNSVQDVYIADLLTGAITLVSRHTDGTSSADYCDMGAISGDGTKAAFSSYASNLVDGDTNFAYDIFFRDVLTQETTRVSIPSGASEADGSSNNPAIAGNAPVVVFDSAAANLVESDFNGNIDVFIRDSIKQSMKMVSVSVGGAPANGPSRNPACSSDGRFVAFQSTATDLVFDDFNGLQDIFVRDVAADLTLRVSRDPSGNDPNGQSDRPSISADGRFVAFESDASNLVANDTNGMRDIFVFDRQTGVTVRASVATGGVEQVTGSCLFPHLSADGRHVTFTTTASDLVAGDLNGVADIFVHDLLTGVTLRVSEAPGNVDADAGSALSKLSATGRHVVFVSLASNLAVGDGNGVGDVFVYDRDPNGNGLDGPDASLVRISVSDTGGDANGDSMQVCSISENGRYVAFTSEATNLVSGDTNGFSDVFVRDRDVNGNGLDGTDAATIRVSVTPTGDEALGGGSDSPSISPDGRWVTFASDATNLAFPDVQGHRDVFIRGPLN